MASWRKLPPSRGSLPVFPWPGAASGGAAKAIEGSIFKASSGRSTLPAGNYQLDAAIGTYLLFPHNKTLSGSAIKDAVQGITLG